MENYRGEEWKEGGETKHKEQKVEEEIRFEEWRGRRKEEKQSKKSRRYKKK
jgi:hypothetical protein